VSCAPKYRHFASEEKQELLSTLVFKGKPNDRQAALNRRAENLRSTQRHKIKRLFVPLASIVSGIPLYYEIHESHS